MNVIPQLERQLVDAARRRRRRAVRAAAIAAALTIVAAAALVVPALLDSAGDERSVPAAPQPQPKPTAENPPLEDLLSVFRRPRTAHDRANFTLHDLESSGDRQPGESPADSRRIDLPGGPVYLWRMTDGVCASWGNCLRTKALAQLGVAVAYGGHSGAGGRPRLVEVSGIVVDGIDQVQIGPEHGNQLVVPVKDNVFHVDLSDWELDRARVLWRQEGRWRHQDITLP